MSVRVLVQSCERELADLVVALLEPYRFDLLRSESNAESIQVARKCGPIELVVCLDPDVDLDELRTGLRETSPETRALQLPSSGGGTGHGEQAYLETPDLLLDAAELTHVLERALATRRQSVEVSEDSLKHALTETILTYSLVLEQFEFINGGNGRLVMEYAQRVAREFGLSSTHIDEIGFAALLQDIGLAKLMAPKRGNERPDRAVDDKERGRAIQQHPYYSANLVERMKLPWRLRHILLAHHEWYNGLGYPRGLRGRDIPLSARILAVVNAFFSMISRRPQRAPLGKSQAIAELCTLAGRQFDPEVVELFLDVMKDKAFREGATERRSVAVVSCNPEVFGHVVASRFASCGHRATSRPLDGDSLNAIVSDPPDAIILDVNLENMNGFQFLHWLKQEPRVAELPVLVLADDKPSSTESFLAHDMGADDFLVKPVKLPELIARVNALIRRHERIARAELSQIHDGEGIRGSLDELDAPTLFRLLREGRKTATVKLRNGDASGVLTFDAGTLVHASTPAAVGEVAFKQIYAWRRGDFLIEHGAATARRSITRHLDLLLAEADSERAEVLRAEEQAQHRAIASPPNERPAAPPAPSLDDDDTAPRSRTDSGSETLPAIAAAAATDIDMRAADQDTNEMNTSDEVEIEVEIIDDDDHTPLDPIAGTDGPPGRTGPEILVPTAVDGPETILLPKP